MLVAIDANDGESCPGADTCREEKGPGNLWKYPDQDDEEICKGCKFYTTKPTRIPDEIARHAATATGLSELQRSGASFSYPQALSPVEWSSLTGLTRGRDQAEIENRKTAKKKHRQKNKPNG